MLQSIALAAVAATLWITAQAQEMPVTLTTKTGALHGTLLIPRLVESITKFVSQ